MLEVEKSEKKEQSVHHWPTDALGNELRKGTLVVLKIPEQMLTCRVMDVIAAGIMHDPENKPMALEGSVTFIVRIGYPVGGNIPMALVLKEPETQAAPKLVKPS
jgi:hypothetical protein